MNTLDENRAHHTGEAYNWLANDEELYQRAQRIKYAGTLKRLWQDNMPKGTVNVKYVQWKQVLKDIKEE